jgi:hypothetical protein
MVGSSMSHETDVYRLAAEEMAKTIIDNMPEVNRWISYFYLYNMYGCRIDSIEHKIESLIREAVKKG